MHKKRYSNNSINLFNWQNHKDFSEMQNFTFIDLFAGIGGMRLGFESVGGKCIFSSEWDTSAQKTYSTNFNEVPHGDITNISPQEIPKFDMLLAGFPCQPFSQAGLKMGFEDTRGTLFFNIAEIVKYHSPEVVFLENVKNLSGHDNGRTLKTIVSTLEDLNYKVFYKVLNARDFGLPQNRARIYIVCFKSQVFFEFPNPVSITTNVGKILENEVNEKYTISDKLWDGHQRRKKEHKEKGNGFGYSLFNNLSAYTSTLSARYYKDGSEILIQQNNKNPRKLTPREAARLQGFPEDFKIPVSDTQAYRQFGNSVAVPVIEAIAQNILEALKTKLSLISFLDVMEKSLV
jgi:DNA (cytosine-5)-methyltransferase 1